LSRPLRHCEERKRRSNPAQSDKDWIASLTLAMAQARPSSDVLTLAFAAAEPFNNRFRTHKTSD
jgi:hypothetical protein